MKSIWRRASVLAAPAVLGVSAFAQSTPALSTNLPQDEVHAPATATLTEIPKPSSDVSSAGVSQVRIVRLSQVKGVVELDRQTGEKFGQAFVNLPIVAGARLQTLDGLAEVEFEDNSSLRLTPNSLVEFPLLGRDATGATSTAVKLLRGSLYVSLADGKSSGSFTINAGNETISPTPASRLRLDLNSPAAKLVVLKGDVAVSDAAGTMMVNKKKSVSFDTASATRPVPAHGDSDSPYDKWNKEEADYHSVRSSFTSSAGASPLGSSYLYGVNDLSYYGSFSDIAGCGTMWRPYLTSASWSPYQSGIWTLYPGAGYSWVSPYPWGWTPYHSGSWELCGAGWGWRPGGAWNGLNNLAAVRTTHGPLLPTLPKAGAPTLVAVNVKTMPVSRLNANSAFVFAGDSAGMGVPRGVFSHLGKISQNVAQHGSSVAGLSDSQVERAMVPTNRAAALQAANNRSAAASGSAALSSASSAAHAGPSFSAAAAHSAGSSPGGGGSHH